MGNGTALGDGKTGSGPAIFDSAGRPGSGGINRGRGDAPMVWGDPCDPEGAVFKPQELPPGFVDIDSTETIGVRYGAPEESGERGSKGGTAAESGHGEAAGAMPLSPARKELLRRYFDAGKKKADGGD